MYEKLLWRKLLELYFEFSEVGIALGRYESKFRSRDDNNDR